MAASFLFLQASNPRSTTTRDAADESLSDALQTVFPLETERAILVWNGIYVPLGYKYDWSLMVDDVIDMCDSVLMRASGTREIHWPSGTFAAVWRLTWDPVDVQVESEWSRVVGNTESLLNNSSVVSMERGAFLAEWRRPLEVAAEALVRAGYSRAQLARLGDLESILTRLPRYGRLYGGG